jgi:hypothetical protein
VGAPFYRSEVTGREGGGRCQQWGLMPGKERGWHGGSASCGEGGWRAGDGGWQAAVVAHVLLYQKVEEGQREVGHCWAKS